MVLEREQDLDSLRLLGQEVAGRQGLEFNEVVVNSDIGAAAVLGQWGMELGPEELRTEMERHLVEMGSGGIGKSFVGKTGFDRSWWGNELRYEEILPFQVELVRAGILKVLEPLGVTPDQLGRIAVATTTPMSMKLARMAADSLGISQDVKAEVVAAACNSAGLMLDQFLLEKGDYSDNPGLQAIVAIENVMSFRYPMDEPWFNEDQKAMFSRGITDKSALSIFSDRLAAVVFDPDRFQVLARATHAMKDEKGVLGAVNTVPFEGEEVGGYDGLVLRNENGYVAYLPDPLPDQAGYIDPLGTTKFIVRLLRTLVGKFKDVAAEMDVDYSSVDHVLIHHPSILIHKYVRDRLGLSDVQAPWSNEHCNAPACTFGMEFARVLPNLKQGDKMMTAFFGAGGTGQINLSEIV